MVQTLLSVVSWGIIVEQSSSFIPITSTAYLNQFFWWLIIIRIMIFQMVICNFFALTKINISWNTVYAIRFIDCKASIRSDYCWLRTSQYFVPQIASTLFLIWTVSKWFTPLINIFIASLFAFIENLPMYRVNTYRVSFIFNNTI